MADPKDEAREWAEKTLKAVSDPGPERRCLEVMDQVEALEFLADEAEPIFERAARVEAVAAELAEALQRVKDKAGSHTIASLGRPYERDEDDPGFRGIYAVATAALAKYEQSKAKERG